MKSLYASALFLALGSSAVAQGISVTSISFSQGSIPFNAIQIVRLDLSGPAPAGTVAKVMDDSPYVSFPRDVPVPEGATWVEFRVYTGGDQFFTGQGSYPVNVTASVFGTTTATNSFSMIPQQSWWFWAPVNVYGGDRFSANVGSRWDWLTDGMTIYFSDNSPLVSTPKPLFIWPELFWIQPEFYANFYSYPVTQATPVTIRSSHNGFHMDHVVTLHPRPVLTTVQFAQSTVIGGNPATGSVFMSFPGAGGAISVELASNSPTVHMNSPTVVVPMNEMTATFGVTTLPVTVRQVVTIRARYRGVVRAGKLYVDPAP
jgi:hypothetical protein